MARGMRPRFSRGKMEDEVETIKRIVSGAPYGSPSAHPIFMRRYLAGLVRSPRYGLGVVHAYVRELGTHTDAWEWFPDRVKNTLFFPEQLLGMEQAEPYEIGARDSEVLDMIGFSDARRREICRFVFYRAQGRPFDAIEAASLALIEIERATNPSASDSDIVSAVRRTEKAALRAALFE